MNDKHHDLITGIGFKRSGGDPNIYHGAHIDQANMTQLDSFLKLHGYRNLSHTNAWTHQDFTHLAVTENDPAKGSTVKLTRPPIIEGMRELIDLVEVFGHTGPPASPEHVAKLARILRVLNTNAGPLRDRIIIFGSVARGTISEYSDIDIMIDLHDQDHGMGFMYHPNIDGIGIFLAIARKYYGLVDVFVRTKRWMATRSDDARHWIPAKGARALWKAAQTEGKTLDVVLHDLANV